MREKQGRQNTVGRIYADVRCIEHLPLPKRCFEHRKGTQLKELYNINRCSKHLCCSSV